MNAVVPPTIEDSETTIVVNESDSAWLPCVASGRPAPNITWIYDGKTVLTSGGRFEIVDSGTLIISNVQVQHLFSPQSARRRRRRVNETIYEPELIL